MSWLGISTLIPAESTNHYNTFVKRRRNTENGALLQRLTSWHDISGLIDRHEFKTFTLRWYRTHAFG